MHKNSFCATFPRPRARPIIQLREKRLEPHSQSPPTSRVANCCRCLGVPGGSCAIASCSLCLAGHTRRRWRQSADTSNSAAWAGHRGKLRQFFCARPTIVHSHHTAGGGGGLAVQLRAGLTPPPFVWQDILVIIKAQAGSAGAGVHTPKGCLPEPAHIRSPSPGLTHAPFPPTGFRVWARDQNCLHSATALRC